MNRLNQAAAGRCAGRGYLMPTLLLAFALVIPAWAAPIPAGAKAVPQRLLVGVGPGINTAKVDGLQADTGARLSKRLAAGRVLVLDFPPGANMAEMYAMARSIPGVQFVEPDIIVYPNLVPNDPEYDQQYHWPLIRAPEAWNVTIGCTDVVIAVVDTGCDLDHPDLVGRFYTNPLEVPGNGIDDDLNGLVDDVTGWDFQNDNNNANPNPDGVDNDGNGDPDDQVNHGTLVAGIACATGNNGFGVAGMNWGARILPVQVFPDDGGSSVATVIEGIDYAVAMGVDIINLSLGGGYSQSFTPAIANAYNNGILVVSAGGNSGRQLTDSQSTWESPVCNDGTLGAANNVFGVGGTDQFDRIASFSNFDGSTPRNFIECCAPAQGIYGPAYYDPTYAHLSEYNYTNSGTSFGAPMVTGLAAMLMCQHPTWTHDQVRAEIMAACDDIDALNPGFEGKLGAGRVNAARALGLSLPPRPPRDVAAEDTAGDEGGSITVQWQPSLDDGAGANSVTEYIVRRAELETGPFTEVDRVPAGTAEFADTTVTDGVDYYYRVVATDGLLESEFTTVGPVQSRNDNPPPPVEGTQAFDTPSDDGGSITVTWDPYTPPADFAQFAIYRAGAPFTNLGTMLPIALVTSAAATAFEDETVIDGAEYHYAVGAVDSFGNVDKSINSVGPAQSFSNGPIDLPAGLHFIGPPVEPANPNAAAFYGVPANQLQLAVWRAATESYNFYSPADPVNLTLGRGHWLKLDAPLSFVPNGAPAPAGDLPLDMRPGWRQVANPFFGSINLANATVVYQGNVMDLASADAANVMRRIAWAYDRGSNSYRMLAPGLGLGPTDVAFMEGLWVLVEKNCTLRLPRPSGVASAAAEASKGPEDGWVARLCVHGPTGTDSDNFFGVSGQLAAVSPMASPPPPADGVDLHFVDQSRPGLRLAGRFSAVEARELSWRFAVAGPPAGGEMAVWCPDVSEIGARWRVVVEDIAAGRSVDIGRGARYSFTMKADEPPRVMNLRLTRSAGLLTLGTLTAQQTSGGGAQVSFTLSAPATCAVRVMNIAGRTVRIIERDRLRPQGLNEVTWNGRSELGTLVPGGVYLVTVEAAGDDGTQVRAMRSLSVQR